MNTQLVDGSLPQQMDGIERTVVGLVNFEAFVMEVCLTAAKKLAERNLQQLSSVTHGPDSGPGINENPVMGALAINMYQEVCRKLKNGPDGIPK